MPRALVLAFAALISPVATSLADPAEPAVSTAAAPETVVVEAARPVTTLGGASAVTVEVDSLSVPAAPTAEQVLRELPLLHVRTNSRGEAELSARGSESRQVAVLVDGIPITLAWDARADVSVIPATAFGGVRYTRGLASVLDGPNVLGGVIEIDVARLRTQPARASLQATLGLDDVGAVGATTTATLPLESDGGAWLLRGGLGWRDSPGDPLARDVAEPVATGDDLRLNTDLEHLDGFLSARYQAHGGAWVSLSGSAFRRERGIAAELGLPDADARLWRYPHVSRALAVLSAGTGLRTSPLGGLGDVEVSLGLDTGRTDVDAYATRAYEEIVSFEDARDRTVTARVLADQTLGAHGDLRAAFTWSTVRRDEIIPAGEFDYRQDLLSLGLETDWRLLESRGVLDLLAAEIGGVYDRARTPRAGGRETQPPLSEPGGRAGLTAVFSEGRTVLHGGVSRRGRFPSLRELYSGALDRFAPNPDLSPERLLTVELGATTRLGEGLLQAVLFRNRLDDAVVRVQLDDGTGRYMRVNRDRLETTGLELVAVRDLGRLEVSASAVFQSVELTDPTAGRTNRPENLPEAFGALGLRADLARGLVARARVSYTGEQSAIDALTGGDAALPARAVVDVSVSRRWALGSAGWGGMVSEMEIRLAVRNLGDAARYDAWGLPGAGRSVGLEARVR